MSCVRWINRLRQAGASANNQHQQTHLCCVVLWDVDLAIFPRGKITIEIPRPYLTSASELAATPLPT